jgi:hypothetical protein
VAAGFDGTHYLITSIAAEVIDRSVFFAPNRLLRSYQGIETAFAFNQFSLINAKANSFAFE